MSKTGNEVILDALSSVWEIDVFSNLVNRITVTEFWLPIYEFLYGEKEVNKLKEEYKIIGYKTFKDYTELQLVTDTGIDCHSYKVKTALVKNDKICNYKLGEFVICRYRKYGEKWYFFPAKCSTPKPCLESFKECGLDELPF